MFRASIAAQRRQELERRAIEKAEAEDARRREEAAAARQKEREQQINSLLEINLKVCLEERWQCRPVTVATCGGSVWWM